MTVMILLLDLGGAGTGALHQIGRDRRASGASLVADRPAAVAEVARVLGPAGRFVFTTWEPPSLDHTALLAAAGVTVAVREETAGSRARQLTFYEGVLAAADLLRRELGAVASQVLIEEARHTGALLAAAPRLLILAIR